MDEDVAASREAVSGNGRTIFVLSPANLSGRRANFLLRSDARCELALRLRATGASLGEVFSFVSGLYFRGKLAYAGAFAKCGTGTGTSVFVITGGRGLVSPDTWTRLEHLQEMAGVSIDMADARYRLPLERDLLRLASDIGERDRVVLLGSVATPKYVEPLAQTLGERLMIPAEFVGLGDMSRGALMLRAVREGKQLEYMRVAHAVGRSAPKTA